MPSQRTIHITRHSRRPSFRSRTLTTFARCLWDGSHSLAQKVAYMRVYILAYSPLPDRNWSYECATKPASGSFIQYYTGLLCTRRPGTCDLISRWLCAWHQHRLRESPASRFRLRAKQPPGRVTNSHSSLGVGVHAAPWITGGADTRVTPRPLCPAPPGPLAGPSPICPRDGRVLVRRDMQRVALRWRAAARREWDAHRVGKHPRALPCMRRPVTPGGFRQVKVLAESLNSPSEGLSSAGRPHGG